MLNARGFLLWLALLLCVQSGCRNVGRQSNEVPPGTRLADVFVSNPWAPYRREGLLGDVLQYGEPDSTGFVETRSENHYIFFEEYVGDWGRIRIVDEIVIDQRVDDILASSWLELHPVTLDLRGLIKGDYLDGVNENVGDWQLSIFSVDQSWNVSLELDGSAVTKLIEDQW